MSSATKRILDEALNLPEEDRRRLAETLLDSMPSAEAQEIEQAWNDEATSRANATENGQISSLNGEQVLEQLERRR